MKKDGRYRGFSLRAVAAPGQPHLPLEVAASVQG
jgi:hypothetical protein